MELTNEEKSIVINLLSQVSLPVKDARIVIEIIEKLSKQLQAVTNKVDKVG